MNLTYYNNVRAMSESFGRFALRYHEAFSPFLRESLTRKASYRSRPPLMENDCYDYTFL